MEGIHHKVLVDAAAHDSVEINDLPDDVIVEILSRVKNRRDAVRTSILSRKWRYLPSLCSSLSVPVTLVLDHKDLSTKSYNSRAQFREWVDRVLKLHRVASLDGLIIRSSYLEASTVYSWTRNEDIKPGDVEKLVYFAVRKRVKVFELESHQYKFPYLKTLPPGFLGVKSFAFVSLTFVGVNIGNEVIHHILERCPDLEKLCIRGCTHIKDLKVVDYSLPSLKFLEISYSKRLEISVPSLVSCKYGGDEVVIPYKKNPNLGELTLEGNVAWYFVHFPFDHASYSHQLVILQLNFLTMFVPSDPRYQHPDLPRLCSLKHLELNLVLPVGKSIHFFIKFINRSPLLKELSIKISYIVKNPRSNEELGFPEESPSSKLDRNHHKNLKVVKMSGYVGCAVDDKFILRLLNIAHESLETVAIETESEYYDQKPWDCATQCNPKGKKGRCGFCSVLDIGARTRAEAKRRANLLKLSFPQKTKAVLIVI